MSNKTSRFKVTLEFEVDINPIAVPDTDAFQQLGKPQAEGKVAGKPPGEKEMRAALKAKGLSDAEVKKSMAGASKKGKTAAGKTAGRDYQMLLYPEYETWAAAQQTLLQEILGDETLSSNYVREIVRDLTRGQVEVLIDEKYGAPDLNGVLTSAMQKLSASDREVLKADQQSLLHEETELVDAAVGCRFAGLTVTKA